MRRILALRQDNNGDVILAGPAIRTLARYGEVTLVCGPSGQAAAHLLPGVSRLVVWRADWIEARPQPLAATPSIEDAPRGNGEGHRSATIACGFSQDRRRKSSARSVFSQEKPPSGSGGRPKWP